MRRLDESTSSTCTLFGLNFVVLVKPQASMDFGLLLLFYGLYLGVVGRDFAEVCADLMASQIGVSYIQTLITASAEFGAMQNISLRYIFTECR